MKRRFNSALTARLTVLALTFVILFCGCEFTGTIFTESGGAGEPEGLLTLDFLYVGQADCTLVTLPTGEYMLVDGGNDADGEKVADYLEDIGVDRLDYVVNTHPHEDHLGGLDKILSRFEAGKIYAPDLPPSAEPDTKNYKDFVKAAEKQCGITNLSAGERLIEENGITVDCLSPDSRDIFSNLNDYSIVLRITYGGDSFLLMGDAEKTAEDIILRSGAEVSADLIKAGHHGSSTSSSEKFIEKVSPDYAVISCGKDNSYKFPHSETIQTYSAVGAETLVTYDVGSVRAVSDGNGITVTADKRINLNG